MATRYLPQVYSPILSNPLNLAVLKSLEELLEYLAGVGRSNASCRAVDLFYTNSEEWERDWTDQALPDDFDDVLAMMGQALHDTVATPDVAANFDCLAEQLLERVRRLGLA